MSPAGDRPTHDKHQPSDGQSEGEINGTGSQNGGRGAPDLTINNLSRARQRHHLLRFLASVLGVLIAWWLLHASLKGTGDLHKIEEAVGSALMFAAITGIGATIVRWLSRVEQHEIAVLRQESQQRRLEQELVSMEFSRLHEHIGRIGRRI
jgi:hypothetical protein